MNHPLNGKAELKTYRHKTSSYSRT